MPSYIYHCIHCGHEQVTSHGMTEDIEVRCARCDRLMGIKPQSTPFRFRGPGGENDLRTRTTRP